MTDETVSPENETKVVKDAKYWATASSQEKFAETLRLSIEKYKELGLYEDGQKMDKSVVIIRDVKASE